MEFAGRLDIVYEQRKEEVNDDSKDLGPEQLEGW